MKEWHKNIGIIDELKNNIFYMEKYYETVLEPLNAFEVIKELSKFGDNIILLCYEPNKDFCHRHLVAAWLELELNITINEVFVYNNGELEIIDSPIYYKNLFKKIIKSYQLKKILKKGD